MRTLSKYRKCEDCSHKFVIPKTLQEVEQKYFNKKKELMIFCPHCNGNSISIIDKKTYEGVIWTS